MQFSLSTLLNCLKSKILLEHCWYFIFYLLATGNWHIKRKAVHKILNETESFLNFLLKISALLLRVKRKKSVRTLQEKKRNCRISMKMITANIFKGKKCLYGVVLDKRDAFLSIFQRLYLPNYKNKHHSNNISVLHYHFKFSSS